LDIEWLLSTLFDASLFNFRAAGNGGSFFALSHFGSTRGGDAVQRHRTKPGRHKCSPSVLEFVAGQQLCLHVRASDAGQRRSTRAILSSWWSGARF